MSKSSCYLRVNVYGFRDVVSQLRVMDKDSGELLWSADLPGTGAGAHPITYELGGNNTS